MGAFDPHPYRILLAEEKIQQRCWYSSTMHNGFDAFLTHK